MAANEKRPLSAVRLPGSWDHGGANDSVPLVPERVPSGGMAPDRISTTERKVSARTRGELLEALLGRAREWANLRRAVQEWSTIAEHGRFIDSETALLAAIDEFAS